MIWIISDEGTGFTNTIIFPNIYIICPERIEKKVDFNIIFIKTPKGVITTLLLPLIIHTMQNW